MAAGCSTGGTQSAGGPPDPRQAPAGILRAVFIASNPVQAAADPKTGEVSGPAAEIARELARRRRAPACPLRPLGA